MSGASAVRRVAFVTGASRGIGAAVARALAARGVVVAVHYRERRDAAEAVLASLAGEGHGLVDADLADPASTAAAWADAEARFGPIDVLVNNAGVFLAHPPLGTSLDDWQALWRLTVDVNLVGPANLSWFAARSMAARPLKDAAFGRGRIVNVSSRGAFRGEPEAPAYGATKAGLNALSQSLAKALAPNAIHVYCLAPGWVDTDMAKDHLHGPGAQAVLEQHPLGRVNGADEIANAAVYCALDAPPAMTGSILDLNGASYLRT